MFTNTKPKVTEEDHQPTIYYLNFEEYLKPRGVIEPMKNILLYNDVKAKRQLHLRLLEQPMLITGRKAFWQNGKVKFNKIFDCHAVEKRSLNFKPKKKVEQLASVWYNKTVNKPTWIGWGHIQLPRFLRFLRARNDDGLCKRKSGFEIYCEMASIHGFINFVDATTWQRAFWFSVVTLAVIMSGFILLLSYFMNTNTPTILYAESTQYPTWSIPFPAVTICNLNRISKHKALNLAEKFVKPVNITSMELAEYFKLSLSLSHNIKDTPGQLLQLKHVLQQNKYTLQQLLDEVQPNCELELLRCKWQGRFERCSQLFQKIRTSYGLCCAFNYKALKRNINKRTDYILNDEVEYITSCGFKSGLTVLLQPHLKDYQAVETSIPGYQVLIHDAYDFPDFTAPKELITTTSFNKIHVLPLQTYGTDYVSSQHIYKRRCFLPNERKLFHFGSYSQTNCLAECRSQLIYEKCHCALPNWPKKANWSLCELEDKPCITAYKSLLASELQSNGASRAGNRLRRYNERFICDCYPLCDFNMYSIAMDSGSLIRKYSLTDERFFKSINITDHILLHVYFGELYAERLRLDVYENWWSFIGTFGGITGLYMGYSFVSGFELIFFVFVRPVCNWLTRKQIQYRIKQRHKKANETKIRK